MRHFNKKWDNPSSFTVDRVKHILPEYDQWSAMMNRSKVGGKFQARYPTYTNCTCEPSWESYDVWLEWARKQIGFLRDDTSNRYYSLDKDVLFKGNKHYSPETCVFVPRDINVFLTNRSGDRGEYPIGVYLKRGLDKYGSQVSLGKGLQRHLGYFDTPIAAFQAYKVAKEDYAKLLAVKYTGLVDPRVVDALNNFTVEISD